MAGKAQVELIQLMMALLNLNVPVSLWEKHVNVYEWTFNKKTTTQKAAQNCKKIFLKSSGSTFYGQIKPK